MKPVAVTSGPAVYPRAHAMQMARSHQILEQLTRLIAVGSGPAVYPRAHAMQMARSHQILEQLTKQRMKPVAVRSGPLEIFATPPAPNRDLTPSV